MPAFITATGRASIKNPYTAKVNDPTKFIHLNFFTELMSNEIKTISDAI
jgi:hypothetical protein